MPEINVRLAHCGLRFTPQRQHVYDVLLGKQDHPTAEEVFLRAKKGMPDISMATVYNCLDALVQCGLAKQVNVDRSATRFCPNMHEHSHFYFEGCGGIFDIETVPGVALRSSLIVGFPGETERDFEDTMRLIAEVGLDHSFSFVYSPRPGTPGDSP